MNTEELQAMLQRCVEQVQATDSKAHYAELENTIASLRELGRDTSFCLKVVDQNCFKLIVQVLTDLNADMTTMKMSIFATMSNILLANRSEALSDVLVSSFNVSALIDQAIDLVNGLNTEIDYSHNLVGIILPAIRFIYLLTVDKRLVSALSKNAIDHLLDFLESELVLLKNGDTVQNSLILTDLLKIGYSLLHFNSVHFNSQMTPIIFQMVIDSTQTEILYHYANYISFLPVASLKPFSEELAQVLQIYIDRLNDDLDYHNRPNMISVLNLFNHLALLAEWLYHQESQDFFELLQSKFVPHPGTEVPVIYKKLMKFSLEKNQGFSFGANDDEMIKNLILDLYFHILGNDIELFTNEIGLFLAMNFLKSKKNEPFQIFAQEHHLINSRKLEQNTGVYPLHYNLIEENQKLAEQLPELTEEEKEEEWERLMDTFDKMKKNGMIKLVENPAEFISNQ